MYLYVNNDKEKCGVYQYGLRLYNILKKYYDIDYVEISTIEKYNETLKNKDYKIILINYHPFTCGWFNIDELNSEKHYYIYHDLNICNITQEHIFNTDPTSNFGTPIPRPLQLDYSEIDMKPYKPNIENPTIGTIGFGFDHKNYDRMIDLIQAQFDHATIRMNIPYSYYCDYDGFGANRQKEKCFSRLYKPGIKLEITHNFLSNEELVVFLGSNDINIFLYNEMPGSGCSSVFDYHLCVNRPYAISNSNMFRHVFNENVYCYAKSLKDIMNYGTKHIEEYQKKWSHNAIRDVFSKIFS